MPTVEADVAGYLDTAGITGGATGWTAMIGELPPDPDQVIVVTESGGGIREPALAFERPSFQLLVRGAKRETSGTARRDARAKLSAAIAALHGQTELVLSGQRYAWIWTQGGALALPYDTQGRPAFTQNFTCGRDT